MEKQEFESRVNFTVSDEVFERIHDFYMSTDVEKDVFCINFNWKAFAEYISKGYANTTKEAGKLAEDNLFLERYAKVLEERIERLKNWKK